MTLETINKQIEEIKLLMNDPCLAKDTAETYSRITGYNLSTSKCLE
jgi:hypothetical protein